MLCGDIFICIKDATFDKEPKNTRHAALDVEAEIMISATGGHIIWIFEIQEWRDLYLSPHTYTIYGLLLFMY